jgi:hypothetical protein
VQLLLWPWPVRSLSATNPLDSSSSLPRLLSKQACHSRQKERSYSLYTG